MVMRRFTASLVLAAAAAASLPGLAGRASLDALAPDGAGVHHTQFENDWIRLVRVRYPARTKVPRHGHPASVTTYVYLSDSSPIRFTHHGSRTHVVTRQPTTPGGFRVSRGGDEEHEAENLGPTASDFLRVEFKTDPAGDASPYFRDARPLPAGAVAATDVRFTNRQMRITRLGIPAGGSVEIATTQAAPALLIALGEAAMTADGSSLPLRAGQERWVAAARRERLANAGTAAIELLRIDFLTPPRSGRPGSGAGSGPGVRQRSVGSRQLGRAFGQGQARQVELAAEPVAGFGYRPAGPERGDQVVGQRCEFAGAAGLQRQHDLEVVPQAPARMVHGFLRRGDVDRDVRRARPLRGGAEDIGELLPGIGELC